MQTLDDVNSRVIRCRRCRSMNKGQRRVIGVGTQRPLVFFVGEAPGRLGADKTGVPFTQDRSGMLLRSMMKAAHFSTRRDSYISNVVKCNPRDNYERNRHPSKDEIANCHEFLTAEIEAVKARVVVPLGEVACRELLRSKQSMTDLNGQELSHQIYGRVFPLYHPGYIIRGNYSVIEYRKDFGRLRKFVQL